jgi:hypothetical protein
MLAAASGDARRYAAVTHIDVDSVAERADEIRSLLDGIGIEISAATTRTTCTATPSTACPLTSTRRK